MKSSLAILVFLGLTVSVWSLKRPENVPVIQADILYENLITFFDFPRNHENAAHMEHYMRVRNWLVNIYSSLQRSGQIDFIIQDVNSTLTDYKGDPVVGKNYHLVFRGRHYGTSSDKVIALIAHYESYENACGTDNNGSGQTALVEIAKALAKVVCWFDYTIIIVSNDLEEKGSFGIKHFIYNFLEPLILETGAEFQGAYLFETMMNFNDTPNSQIIPEQLEPGFAWLMPELYALFINNSRRGDFSLFLSRNNTDKPLNRAPLKQWYDKEDPDYDDVLGAKYKSVGLYIPFIDHGMAVKPPASGTILRYFLRGDYKEFYYYNGSLTPLKAVMITDTGNWRGYMAECYAKPCDNAQQLSADRVTFLQKTAQSFLYALLDMANYRCEVATTTTTTAKPPVSAAFVLHASSATLFLCIYSIVRSAMPAFS